MKEIVNTVESYLLKKEDYKDFEKGFVYIKIRKKEVVYARQLCCSFRFSELINEKDPDLMRERHINELIGEEIGFDQATVRHSIKTISDLRDYDKIVKNDYDKIKQLLELHPNTEEITKAIHQGLITLLKTKIENERNNKNI